MIRLELRCLAGRNSPDRRACLLGSVRYEGERLVMEVRMRDALPLPEGMRWETRTYSVWLDTEDFVGLSCKHEQGVSVRASDVREWVKNVPRDGRVRFIG